MVQNVEKTRRLQGYLHWASGHKLRQCTITWINVMFSLTFHLISFHFITFNYSSDKCMLSEDGPNPKRHLCVPEIFPNQVETILLLVFYQVAPHCCFRGCICKEMILTTLNLGGQEGQVALNLQVLPTNSGSLDNLCAHLCFH